MVEQLNKVLILRHGRPAGYSYGGGVVYTDAFLEMLRHSNPGVVIDQCYAKPERSTRLRSLAKAASIMRSATHMLPAKPLHFYSKAFAREVEHGTSSGDYDLVIINGIDVLWCRDLIPSRARALYRPQYRIHPLSPPDRQAPLHPAARPSTGQ